MKKCSVCKKNKRLSSFPRKSSGKLHGYCAPCKKQYNREHYQKNAAVYKSRAVASKKKTLEFFNELKSKPCSDCGVRYNPWVMDFDHRPGTNKRGMVSLIRQHASRQKLLEEIAKCDLVCANCHRERTHKRLGALA